MKVFRLVLLMIGCYFNLSFGQNNLPSVPTYPVNDDLLEQVLPNQEWLIEEGEQSLSIQEIRSGIIKDGTIIEGGDQFSVRRDRAYWYKMVLISPVGNEHEKLSFNQTGSYGASITAPKTVNAYFFFDGKMVDDGYSGIGVGNAQRDVKHVFYPTLIDFNLPSNKPLEIWIKVVSDQDFKGQFATTLVSHRVDITSLNRFGTVNQIVLGSLIFMLLVGLFLWYWFREKVYVWFLIFVLVNLWTIIIYMTGNQFIDSLFPENPILINLILSSNDLVKFLVTLLFGRVFINTRKYFPQADNILIVSIVVFFSLAFVYLLQPNFPGIINFIMLSTIYLALGCFVLILGYFIFSNNKLARFYSVGAITPFLGILYVTISSVLGFKDIQQYGGVFIGLGPVLALGLAMVYRFKIVVDEKLQAEQETKTLLSNQNVILENQVNERTAQLSRSLENLKNTQSQLVQSEKMAALGELTAGIAHEIQNPLNFVNNFSEVNEELIAELNEELTRGNLNEVKSMLSDLSQNQGKIKHHGKRAEAIVKSMLLHSRTSEGQREPTDINALCDEYLRLAYHGFRAKDKSFNADFKTEFDEALPKINIVPQDMGRVLLNLINNAFQALSAKASDFAKASSDKSAAADPIEKQRTNLTDLAEPSEVANLSDFKPLVSISTKLSPAGGGVGGGIKRIQITISDNGSGIPAEIKDKIFQPFFTTKPAGTGTGLGLSLSYDMVKAHGGEIRVEGKGGEGTTFVVLLPVV